MRVLAIVVGLSATLAFSGCGGTDRRHSVNPAVTMAAPYLELRSDVSTGTIHFPRGTYVLDTEDRNGYYYRAPRKLYQRGFYSAMPRDGGIFVSKRSAKKLRGYVIMPAGVTHVGNLSSADYEFRY
jgi:hypothetical protein